MANARNVLWKANRTSLYIFSNMRFFRLWQRLFQCKKVKCHATTPSKCKLYRSRCRVS